jgi:hypothetical protein
MLHDSSVNVTDLYSVFRGLGNIASNSALIQTGTEL